MSYPRRPPGAPILPAQARPAAGTLRPWTVSPPGVPPRNPPPGRRYEILWLTEAGMAMEMTRTAPAIPVFESAFTAFARGALIATPLGEVAIEDLLPGMPVLTRRGPRKVRWLGRILLPPPSLRPDQGPAVYRLTADSLGHMRPSTDLVLLSGARLVHRSPGLAARGSAEVLVPVADFADGIGVTRITPMSAVPAFHLALDTHSVIEANGVEVETFHPGPSISAGLSGDMTRLFLSLFPHLDESRSFGPLAMPRLGLEDIDSLARRA